MQYGRNGPKAIETKWHGCRFRSKLEAQWAIVFEVMGLEWEYEPMGFRLGNGLWYMPDFVIAGLVGVGDGWCFVEVKGNMTELDRRKVDEFSRYYPIYVVGEVPYQDPFGTQHRKFAKDTAFHSLSRLFVERSKGVVESGAIGVGHDGMPEIVPEWEWAGDERATRLAFLAACYARFDHGEMPEQQKEFREAQVCIQWLREASKKKETKGSRRCLSYRGTAFRRARERSRTSSRVGIPSSSPRWSLWSASSTPASTGTSRRASARVPTRRASGPPPTL